VVQTAVNGGLERLIFAPRAARSHDLSLSLVAHRWPILFQVGWIRTSGFSREVSRSTAARCLALVLAAVAVGLVEAIIESPKMVTDDKQSREIRVVHDHFRRGR
jgi:hypothetical protein